MTPAAKHLHTFFLLPFSIDKEAVIEDDGQYWPDDRPWLEGLDDWVTRVASPHMEVPDKLGRWERQAYTRFDMDSRAYQDMAHFHPFVRRIFFDVIEPRSHPSEQESLLRCYVLPIPSGKRLNMSAEDHHGVKCAVEVAELRLFLFANGLGILSIAIEAKGIPVTEALWINEMLRRVYPTSGRQVREGRVPSSISLRLEGGIVVEDHFAAGEMIAFLPPLSRVQQSLLYFLDYSRQEYEPVLDERSVVYSFLEVDPATVPPAFKTSEDYQILLSRFLYVDRAGIDYRYDREFLKKLLARDLYSRWAHQGTWYGFTGYSSITCTIGTFDCGMHTLDEGFLVHRMFSTRYYLMTVIALFYRASLLDFSERTALVSRRLYEDQQKGQLTPENIALANALRNQFLHFANYWYFQELANKDEEEEHFAMLSAAYRLNQMKQECDREIETLKEASAEFLQRRNTEAVNRLALLSTILGVGAVITGYFGMNFAQEFGQLFFEPKDSTTPVLHYGMIALSTVFALGALTLCVYLFIANWSDYRGILRPDSESLRSKTAASLKRGSAGR